MTDSHSSITDRLAKHVAHTRFAQLPAREISAAQDSLFDTMAVAAGAANAPGVPAVLRAARRESAAGPSTLWLDGTAATPARAAFVNSVCAAALDFDSLHHLAVAHSDIVVVPAAVAVAQARRCSGQELLAAIVLGNDVLCRLALATRGEYRGWFFTSVYGVIAAAAVAARLLGGSAKAVRDAMGLAFMNSAGTFQAIEERSMAKRALAAFAARAGVECALLAIEGFDGPSEVVEGRHGLYNVYQRGRAELITDGLGERFEGAHISRKPFPTCQCNQAAVEATLALRQAYGLRVADVAHAEVVLTPYNHRLVGMPFDPSRNPQVAAQFSAQYSVACALLHGCLGVREIEDARVLDPVIGELARRVVVSIDHQAEGTYTPSRVILGTRDGRTFVQAVDVLRGSVEAPLSRDELVDKAAGCIPAASAEAATQAARSMLREVLDLANAGREASPGLRRIERLLREN